MSIPNMVIMLGIDIVFLLLYAVTLNYLQDQNAALRILMNIVSNMLLVGISVLSTTVISIPLIEVRSKNSLYDKILLDDVLSDPRFYNALSKEDREKMLRSLEANLHFRGSATKEDMFQSIRKKLNTYHDRNDTDAEQCYLESCSYHIKCEICGQYFCKTVNKVIDIRAYEPINKRNFPLCITSAPVLNDRYDVSEVETLIINGRELNVNDCVETKSSNIHNNAFDKKSGYTRRSGHFYKGNLHLTPDKPTKITVNYKTYVPIRDTFYSCRTSYPCHKFQFSYMLSGKCADEYSLSVCAFGFVDDGRETPNRSDSNPDIEVNFENWIFPLDGVAVTMLKNCEK